MSKTARISTLGMMSMSLFLALVSVRSAHAQASTYTIDPTHTFVTWEALHFGASTSRGRFDKTEGSIQMDRSAKSGRIDVTIATGSINTGLATFDNVLRGSNFFDSEKYPTARFVSDRLNFDGDKVQSAVGQLTMIGKTFPVTLTALRFKCYDNPYVKREVCGGDFEATFQRSVWGMNYAIPAAADDVKLLIQVEAVKQ